ncbi:MAG: hypothetical protein JWO98_4743 [Frankiales bacterium]|nr:hypothetical protein [Frankiales bacterium]
MALSRGTTQAARRFAEQQASRLRAIPANEIFMGTVATVTAGGAADGIAALVTVTPERGTDALTVNSYPDSYTPGVGDPVLCVIAKSQLHILHRCIGQP